MASIPFTSKSRLDLQSQFTLMLDRHEENHLDAFPMTTTEFLRAIVPNDVRESLQTVKGFNPTMLNEEDRGTVEIRFSNEKSPEQTRMSCRIQLVFARPRPFPAWDPAIPGIILTEEHRLHPDLQEWALEAWKIKTATEYVMAQIMALTKASNTIGQVLFTWPKMHGFLTDEQKVALGGSRARGYAPGAHQIHADFRKKYNKLNSWVALAYMLPDREEPARGSNHMVSFTVSQV